MNRTLIWGFSFLATTGLLLIRADSAVAAPYSYRYAYVHQVTGELQLQRASESEPELGEMNVPLVPGDRLWTDASSRAEIRFADGTILRMDEFTKVDLVDFDAEQAVRVWNGSVIVIVSKPRANVRIDTPSGSVYPAEDGHFRIDVRDGLITTLSVNRGVAELVSDSGSVLVRGGQRSVLESGLRPDSPFSFNTAQYDEFDHWSDEQDRYATTTYEIPSELPHEVHHYAGNLSHHGEWHQEASHGYVWYPRVDVGWAPYRHGRWRYTHFGYTWISHEPWGWAPYHYGRWGYGVRGWYWIPGSYWGPAWVSWAFGPDWLGWSPLGYYDRPVFVFNTFLNGRRNRFRGGRAVPRHVYDNGAGWNFTRRRDFQRGGSAGVRLRAADVRGTARTTNIQLLESGAVLERGLKPRAVGGAAVSRLVGTTPLTPARVRARDLERGRTGDRNQVRGGVVNSRSPAPTNSIRSRDGSSLQGRSPRSPVVRGGTESATTRGTLRSRSTRGDGSSRTIEQVRDRNAPRQPSESGTVRGGSRVIRTPNSESGTVRGGGRVIRTPNSESGTVRGGGRVIRTPNSESGTVRGRSRVIGTPNSSTTRSSSSNVRRRQPERSPSGVERSTTRRQPRTTTPLRSRGREFFERSGSTERNTRSTPRVRSRTRGGSSSSGSTPSRVNRSSRGSRSRGTIQRGPTVLRSSPGRSSPRQPSVRSRGGSSRGSQGAVRSGSSRGANRGAASTRQRSNRRRNKN